MKKEKLKIIKKSLLLSFILIYIIGLFVPSFAINVGKQEVTATQGKAYYNIIKWKGRAYNLAYASVKYRGQECPTYCLDHGKKGVIDPNMKSVKFKVEHLLANKNIYKALINGYPYKTPKELGVNDKNEAFIATQIAMWVIQDNLPTSYFTPFDTAVSKRIHKAYLRIVENAKKETRTYTNAFLDFLSLDKKWNFKNNYLERRYNLSGNLPGTVNLSLNTNIKDVKLLNDAGKEVKQLKIGENFKIKVPIKNLVEDSTINIKGKGNIKTCPIFFGETNGDNMQNYGVSGIMYDPDVVVSRSLPISKNSTKLIINKIDGNTKIPLEGVRFQVKELNTKKIKEYITDASGKIVINYMFPGKYVIKEIETLPSYSRYDDEINININYNENTYVEVKNNKIKVQENVERYQSFVFDKKEEENLSEKVVKKNENAVENINNVNNENYINNINKVKNKNDIENINKLKNVNKLKNKNILKNKNKILNINKEKNKNVLKNINKNKNINKESYKYTYENNNTVLNEVENNNTIEEINDRVIEETQIQNINKTYVKLPKTGF